jgi:hypothetical protein
MKYKIFRQFDENIWKDPATYKDLNMRLIDKRVLNRYRMSKGYIEGKAEFYDAFVEIRITLSSTYFARFRNAKTDMKGTIKFSPSTGQTREKADDLLNMLAQYSPVTPKKN